MVRLTPSSLLHGAARLEEILLCLLLTAMIVLTCVQIALRIFFASGLLWADPLLRYLVLWSGLLGASMATSRNEHIALDLAGYLLPKQLLPLVQLVCHLFSFITSCFLTYAAILFLQSEIQFGSPGLLAIPSWGWNVIFPLAFGLIALRYLALVATAGLAIIRRSPETTGAAR